MGELARRPGGELLRAAPDLEQLAMLQGLARDAKAPATWRAYDFDWRHFRAWCADERLVDLPADPATVALYLAEHERRLSVATLQRRLSAISQAHQLAGHDSPTLTAQVRLQWEGLCRRQGRAPRWQAAPAGIDTIRTMLATLGSDLRSAQDRALLLLGFAGAFRRSELVALDVADLRDVPEGLRVFLRRSKTDQEGRGAAKGIPYGERRETCPVRAWQAWRRKAQLVDGPAFRGIDRHGNLSGRRLSDKAVARMVKRRAELAGLDPAMFSGHSLRAGHATEAARRGASERAIQDQTGHKSLTVLRGYIREGSLFVDNSAARLGL
jgi:integrase